MQTVTLASNKTLKPALMCAEWPKRSCVASHNSDKRQVGIDVEAGLQRCKSQESSHVSMVSHLQLLGPERKLELHHARDRLSA